MASTDEQAGDPLSEAAAATVEPVMPLETSPVGAAAAKPQVNFARAMRNGLKLGGSLIFTWGIALGVRLVIPRQLGPSRFGLLTFADTFASAGALLLSMGIDTYIRKEVAVRIEHAGDFFGGVSLLRVGMQVFLFGGVTLALHLNHRPAEIVIAAGIFSIARLFETTNNTLSAMLHARAEVDGAAALAVATKVIWAAGVLLALRYDLELWAYAVSFLASEGTETFVLYALAKRHLGLHLRLDRAGTWEALSGGLPFYAGAIAQGVYSRLDITILAFFTTSREVGLYNAAFTVAALILLMAPLLSWVVTPLVSQAAHRSDEEMGVVLGQVMELVVAIVMPLTLAVALGARLWIHLVFGDQFMPGVGAMYILAPMYLATYAGMVFGAALSVSNRGWLGTRGMVIGVAVDIVLNLVLIPIALSIGGPDSGAGGIACATSITISELVVAVLMIWPIRQFLRLKRLRSLFLRNIAVAAPVVIVHFAIWQLGHWRLLCDAALFIAIAFAVKLIEPRKFIALIREARRSGATGPA